MTEEVQPVEEVEIEEVAQPEQTLEIETTETETIEETPAPSAEIDEEAKQKEEARKHFTERQSRREREESKERENEYLRQQLQALQQPQQAKQQNVDPNKPDFDMYLENGYTAQQFYEDSRAYEKNIESKASAENEVINSFSSQMADFAKNTPDVYDYAKEADRLVGPAVQDAILRSTKAPEIIEKIALDPKFADELNRSRDIHDLSRKIARFEMDQPKVKASVSSAPRGPSTPKSQPTVSAQTDLSNLSYAEYAKYRREQRSK